MTWKTCGALLILASTLAGCSPYPLPGPLAYERCGKDGHLESYPLAHDERKAYDITDSSPTCPTKDAQLPASGPTPTPYPTPTLPVWTPLAPLPLPTDSATATPAVTTESF